MKKLFATICVLLIVAVYSNGIYSQDVPKPVKPKVEEKADDSKKTGTEQPQTKPSKAYDLTPKFTKDMKWKETIDITSKQGGASYSRTTTLKLKSNVIITEMKKTKPTKVKFEKMGGKSVSEVEYGDEGEMYNDEDEIKETTFTVDLDDKYRVKEFTDKKSNREIMMLFIFYPAGNMVGFAPNAKAVKVGDSWKSKELYPMNFNLIFAEEGLTLTLKENTGEFKLTGVEEKNDKEIATITWKGKCTIMAPKGESGNLNLTWDLTTKYDVKNRRLISQIGYFKGSVNEDGEEENGLNITFKRLLEHSETKVEEKEPEVKPKSDEDE